MSGYTDDTIVRHGIEEGAVALLTKPFTMEAIAQKVCEVLIETPVPEIVTSE